MDCEWTRKFTNLNVLIEQFFTTAHAMIFSLDKSEPKWELTNLKITLGKEEIRAKVSVNNGQYKRLDQNNYYHRLVVFKV